jgi:SAM-dependent methyltransferase
MRIISKFKNDKIVNYADIGCSNGYLTNILSQELKANTVVGYDHQSLNLDIGRSKYPGIRFEWLDLNTENMFKIKSDFLTCFETLEHVGSIEIALENIINCSKNKGIILLSMPIETGIIGFLKFIIKEIKGYDFPIEISKIRYAWFLLSNKSLHGLRPIQNGYGSHYGFDYRIVEKLIKTNSQVRVLKKQTYLTTRFMLLQKL